MTGTVPPGIDPPSATLAFPSGRVLAGWWKQLAPMQPRALWFAHLLLHRIEALIEFEQRVRLEGLPLFVVRALALATGTNGPSSASLDQLAERLRLSRPLLRQVLRELDAQGLTAFGSDSTWSLKPLGRESLADGTYPRLGRERRVFYFTESESDGPPHFLNLLNHPATLNWHAGESWRFDANLLRDCVARSTDWKQNHGFPLDVREILRVDEATLSSVDLTPKSTNGTELIRETALLPAWQRVTVDRAKTLAVVLVLTPGRKEVERLLGFAVQPEGWALHSAEPAFVVGEGWPQTLPDLAEAPPLERWQQDWRTWCQPRGIPLPEVEACRLELRGERLLIHAPAKLIDRLRMARSDALKGQAWLLAGRTRVRRAARIDVVELR